MLLKKYQRGGAYHHSKNNTNTYVYNDGEPGGLTTTIVQVNDGRRWKKQTYTSGAHKGETYGKVEQLSTIKNGVETPVKLLYKNKKENNSLTFESYLPKLMYLENGVKKGLKGNTWFPHDSLEGGAKTLAYGHKLQKGEDFSKGISDSYAKKLLEKDVLYHKNAAAKKFNERFGSGSFEKLPEAKQVLLTDYHFNGVYDKFPKFQQALYDNDFVGMEREYKRVVGDKPLEERNRVTYEIIQQLKSK